MATDSIRFVHMADVHLGFRQYGLVERAEDFSRAFESAIKYCVEVKPDFVLIAGDLFDAKSIDPQTYADADTALAQLSRAGIPVVANEGNHERWFRRGDHSWLWQLSRHGRLRLLRQFDPVTGSLQADPWTSERGFGAYTDIGPTRVYGVEYLGVQLSAHVAEIATSLAAIPCPDVRYVVGVMHTGVDDAFEHGAGGLTLEHLEPVSTLTNYLALGHVHYAYQLPAAAPWVFNPGSLEAHTIVEGLAGETADGQGRVRGLFDVRIGLDKPDAIEVKFRDDVLVRRGFQRVTVDVTDALDFDELIALVGRGVAAGIKRTDEPPVVELRLIGRLRFERVQLETERLELIVREALEVLHARVTMHFRSSGTPVGSSDTTSTRQEVERDVVRRLIEASPHADQADAISAAVLDLKAAALEGRSPEEMAAYLERTLV